MHGVATDKIGSVDGAIDGVGVPRRGWWDDVVYSQLGKVGKDEFGPLSVVTVAGPIDHFVGGVGVEIDNVGMEVEVRSVDAEEVLELESDVCMSLMIKVSLVHLFLVNRY